MTEEAIAKFREACGSDARNIHKDLDDRIAFIIIAAIGFFVSKSESANLKGNCFLVVLYFVTLPSLFLSFLIFLLNKHKTIKEINDHIEFIDTKMKPNDSTLAQKLVTDWDKGRKRTERYQKWVYGLLLVGFILGITFFTISTLSKTESQKIPQPFKIEMH